MSGIEKDIALLEAALKKSEAPAVQKALSTQIAILKRKVNGVGKHRKVRTADGVLVGIGDNVYSYRLPYLAYVGNGKPEEERPPQITERKIERVMRAGKVELENGWPPLFLDRGAHCYYSTRSAAKKAMLAEATIKAKYDRNTAAKSKHVLSVVRAFDPNRAPRKKRAA